MVLRAPGNAAATNAGSRAAASSNGSIAANGPATHGGPPWAEHLAAVRGVLPEAAWKALTPGFYLLFWTLSSYDIHVPVTQCAPTCLMDSLWSGACCSSLRNAKECRAVQRMLWRPLNGLTLVFACSYQLLLADHVTMSAVSLNALRCLARLAYRQSALEGGLAMEEMPFHLL